jgi:Ni/Fe-hydrogenase subunit HybB-like protein
MKNLAKTSQEIPIVDHNRNEGTLWLIKEKILLGLTLEEYKAMLKRNPINWFLFVLLGVGIPLIIMRYLFGLDTVTHSSNDYPWGLFLGFGLFGMVPLSASGFLLGTTVEIFGRKDFVPIERLALLNGLLGYLFAVIYLEVDLGMPWRLPYPMFVSLGPAAVLFLVAWHVATYLSVQVAEILPAYFEWIGWLKGKRFIKSITIGLTIAGIILSTLHQGALGALFCYAPTKVHPLWLSTNFIWIHFFCSAIFAGLSMVIVVSTLCKRFMTWRCDERFLNNIDDLTVKLGKGCAYAIITYLIIKVVGIAHDNEWAYLLTGWGSYFMLEIGVGVILPFFLFTFGVKNYMPNLIRLAAVISVLGIIWNRLNTALIGFNWKLYQEVPRWEEVWVTCTIFAIYFMVYRFLLYRLPILYEWKGDK